jgi:hypothetical protein
MMLPMISYAACGLMLSLIIHLLFLAGIHFGGPFLMIGLFAGMFPMWFVVVLASRHGMGGVARKDYWKVMMSGCPAWLKTVAYALVGYAIVFFVIFMIAGPITKKVSVGASGGISYGMTGHLIAIYALSLAIFVSIYCRGSSSAPSKCANGHPVSQGDRFCSQCGAPIDMQAGAR